jgi:hypothetical protein
MPNVRLIWRRLLYYLRRDRFDRELEEEMRFHQMRRTAESQNEGLHETPRRVSLRDINAAAGTTIEKSSNEAGGTITNTDAACVRGGLKAT